MRARQETKYWDFVQGTQQVGYYTLGSLPPGPAGAVSSHYWMTLDWPLPIMAMTDPATGIQIGPAPYQRVGNRITVMAVEWQMRMQQVFTPTQNIGGFLARPVPQIPIRAREVIWSSKIAPNFPIQQVQMTQAFPVNTSNIGYPPLFPSPTYGPLMHEALIVKKDRKFVLSSKPQRYLFDDTAVPNPIGSNQVLGKPVVLTMNKRLAFRKGYSVEWPANVAPQNPGVPIPIGVQYTKPTRNWQHTWFIEAGAFNGYDTTIGVPDVPASLYIWYARARVYYKDA